MVNPEDAKSDWANNTDADEWEEGVQANTDAYAEGIADFIGTSPGNIGVDSEWREGVGRSSAKRAYEENTGAEEADEWFSEYVRGVE